MSEFAGRVVLVTGGARGLGRAVCAAFAARGAHVIANYFHSREEARGLDCDLIRASVASREQVDAMFDEIAERHGRLDVLVNNAASGALLPLSDVDDSHWQRAFDTNVRGSLWCAQRAAGLMPAGGAIVNLSSIASVLGSPNEFVAYAATKGAVDSLTVGLAREVAKEGVRVNAVRPGLIDTEIQVIPGAGSRLDTLRSSPPIGRPGSAEEVAEAVVWLLSDAASYVTGALLDVSGGR
jgi:NAD(P)-dependent dehydrogenase (short-subunit alcohol dehydrogenase family)